LHFFFVVQLVSGVVSFVCKQQPQPPAPKPPSVTKRKRKKTKYMIKCYVDDL